MEQSRWLRYLLVFSIATIVVATFTLLKSPAPEQPPLRLAYSLWSGYFPAVIAKEKGFFAAQGVKVETVFSEDIQAQIASFGAGKYDGMAAAIGTLVQIKAANRDVRVILVTDQSVGADAVVASPEVRKVADLKGKVIGTSLGSFGELFVHKMLEAYGIALDQVTLVNMGGDKIPQQLKRGAIQAGNTWEPYVSKVVKDGGNVLFTSKDTPGLISDIIVFQGNVLRDRSSEIRAFVRAWFQALKYWQAHPREGNAIIAKALSIKPEAISLNGIKLLDLSDNKRAFTAGQTTASLYYTAQLYFNFYHQTGNLGTTAEINKVLDPSFLEE